MRQSEEIRASIENNREELGLAIERFRDEVSEIVNWRGQLRRHRDKAALGALVGGFLLGGGLTAVGGALFGRRR